MSLKVTCFHSQLYSNQYEGIEIHIHKFISITHLTILCLSFVSIQDRLRPWDTIFIPTYPNIFLIRLHLGWQNFRAFVVKVVLNFRVNGFLQHLKIMSWSFQWKILNYSPHYIKRKNIPSNIQYLESLAHRHGFIRTCYVT